MSGLPRKNSEFLAMYRKDIEEIIEPYGFVYEDRNEYYGSEFLPAEKWRTESHLYFKITSYGTVYLMISSNGRLSEFDIGANFEPAIQEVANIERKVFDEIGIKTNYNKLQWKNGSKGIKFDLLSSIHAMRDNEIYQKTLKDIKTNLDIYMNLTSPRQLFEYYMKRPNFFTSNFCSPWQTRLGYWLIMAKLAGEDYYTELADKYVEINRDKIQERYNVDITKLKEFLDTYTVGSLA